MCFHILDSWLEFLLRIINSDKILNLEIFCKYFLSLGLYIMLHITFEVLISKQHNCRISKCQFLAQILCMRLDGNRPFLDRAKKKLISTYLSSISFRSDRRITSIWRFHMIDGVCIHKSKCYLQNLISSHLYNLWYKIGVYIWFAWK